MGKCTNSAGRKPERAKWREKRDKMEPTQSKLRICAGKVTFSGRTVPSPREESERWKKRPWKAM